LVLLFLLDHKYDEMKLSRVGLCLGVAVLAIISLSAQSYRLDDRSEIAVSGTSTLHDWTMKLDKGKCSGAADFKLKNKAITGLSAMNIAMEANGLKSGKAAMDRNAYTALNASEHPRLTFEMTQVKGIKKEGEKYLIDCVGKLTVAGATRMINLRASCVVGAAGEIACSGAHTLKMTEFGIEPPSVMLGTIKTGDELGIDFSVVFVK
jgi:polyisoprenoid-binding protein YceI